MTKFNVLEKDTYTIVSFELDTPLTPEELKRLKPPQVDFSKGVVISGRGPIWLYGYLIHFYHPSKFVTIHDPRLGAVVIQSHSPEYKVGDVIKIYGDDCWG